MAPQFLRFLFLATFHSLFLPTTGASVIENPNRPSNIGKWSPWENCPENNFVNGLRLKVSGHGGSDEIVHGVEMICSATFSSNPRGLVSVTSSIENGGTWTHTTYCPIHHLLIGFHLMSETHSAKGQVILQRNLEAICQGGISLLTTPRNNTTSASSGNLVKMECPPNKVVCGIRTQLRSLNPPVSLQSTESKLGLVNVNLECCEEKQLRCTISEEKEIVTSFNNHQGTTSVTKSYSLITGIINESETVSMKESSTTNRQGFAVSGSASLSLFKILTVFKAQGSFESETIKGEVETAMNRFKTTGIFIEKRDEVMEIPPGVKMDLYQIIYKCGELILRTNSGIRIDTKVSEPSSRVRRAGGTSDLPNSQSSLANGRLLGILTTVITIYNWVKYF